MEIGNLQTIILGIETSCDETAAAVVGEGKHILSSVIASQLDVHVRYGGVVPELASREHLRAIMPVVREALEKAEVSVADVDAIAVTAGPGLIGSLLVGVNYAKALCFGLGLPLISVNHVEGHIHSVLMQHSSITYPAVALVVSGGHTHLFSLPEPGVHQLLGKTRDDAAGEAYDKVAKLLGFPYPGGPILDCLAPYGDPRAVKFSAPKIKGSDLDFSFSGIKTAVLRHTELHEMRAEIEARRQLGGQTLSALLAATPQPTLDLIASFQYSVIDDLLRRSLLAAERIAAKSIVVAGGVSCNAGLQKEAAQREASFFFPASGLATDNAAMIAAAALPKYRRGEFAGFDLRVKPNLALAV